jgi:hypothetical protein
VSPQVETLDFVATSGENPCLTMGKDFLFSTNINIIDNIAETKMEGDYHDKCG